MYIEEQTLKVLIACSGLPQKKIARRMGISAAYFTNLIRGRRSWRPRLLIKFCKSIGYPDPVSLFTKQKVALVESVQP